MTLKFLFYSCLFVFSVKRNLVMVVNDLSIGLIGKQDMELFYSPKLFRFYFLVISFCWTDHVWSQYKIQKITTPTELVKEIMGDGVSSVENIKVNGLLDDGTVRFGTGVFSEEGGKLNGIRKGIVLATLPVSYTAFPPDSSKYVRVNLEKSKANHSYFDKDLARVIASTNTQSTRMFDGIVLEFDFTPKGSELEFSYCFASDEYDKFVCSKFNDAFGFFLSGPGIKGEFSNKAINLAVIPGTNTPITINTINRGKPGEYKPDVDKYCDGGKGLKSSAYYVSNNKKPFVLDNVIFNGFTTKLSAKAKVQCGEKYHLKIAITDIGDHLWNSGVFIESGSFTSNEEIPIEANVTLKSPGCAPYLLHSENTTNVSDHYWDFGDGNFSREKMPTHKYQSPGKYKVTYIATDLLGCKKSDKVNFTVDVKAAKQIGASLKYSKPSKCSLQDTLEASLSFDGTDIDSIIWDFGDGEIAYNAKHLNHVYKKAGHYDIKMRAFDFLCSRDSLVQLSLDYSKTPEIIADASLSDSVIDCDNSQIVFNNFSKNNEEIKHYWDFGDGSFSNRYEPKHEYTKKGNFQVTYVISDKRACVETDTIKFKVNVKRTEMFSASLKLESPKPCLSKNEDMGVVAKFAGSSTDSLVWDFGDGSQELYLSGNVNENVQYHSYNKPGTYVLKLSVFDNECNKDSVIEMEVVHEPQLVADNLIAPNIITPNGDFVNDMFTLFDASSTDYDPLSDLSYCEVRIFNRWGKLRFSNNLNGLETQNGSYKGWVFGNNEPDGVYFYSIKFQTKCAEQTNQGYQELSGHLTLRH